MLEQRAAGKLWNWKLEAAESCGQGSESGDGCSSCWEEKEGLRGRIEVMLQF